MPKFKVTSPTGSQYNVEVPEGAEMTEEYKNEIFQSIRDHESAFNQSSVGAFGSGLVRGAMSAVAEPIRGVGELFGSDYIKEAGLNLRQTAEDNAPISPERREDFAVKSGQAIGQGAAQLGLVLGTNVAGLGAKAVQASVLAPAFFAGAAGGADESRRLGVEEGSAADKLNQVLYGGAEVLSESLFGLGSRKFSKALVSDAPNILRTGIRSTAGKRFVGGVAQEAVEEPIAGALQDAASQFTSRISQEFGGPGMSPDGSRTANGAELRSPFDLAARGEEAMYGAIGALPFGGHAALQRDADVKDVAAYRARVAKSRADGEIAPKNQAEVDAMDAKAADFLEKEGVPLMANAAQSVINGDAQGIVELKAIANNPTLSPAVRAAAQSKIDKAQAAYKDIADKIKQHQNGEITFDELKAQIPEYETLNPYSKANQEKQIEASRQQAAAAPVQAVAAANAAVGNTATAQALLDTQAARDKAGALRNQAKAARKAPVQNTNQAPTQTAAPAAQPAASAAQTPAQPPRRQQIQKRLAEIEAQHGPREDIIVGSNGVPTQVHPRRINTKEEDSLFSELDSLDAAENAAPNPAAVAAQPAAAQIQNISDNPSSTLPPRAVSSVNPRPTRKGRDTSERDSWDIQFGDMRKGGRTHNIDGTPYQPTLFDEVAPQVMAARQGMTDDEANEAIGDASEFTIATSLRTLLNAGWTWNAQKRRMVPPSNSDQNESPIAAVFRLQGNESPTPAQNAAPNPAAVAAQTATEAPKDRETQIAETVMPHVEEQVNTFIPARVQKISQALDEGDFETAASQFKALEGIAQLAVLDRPEVARAITARLSPEQQNKIKKAREAANDLVKTVRQHIAAKAAEINTPVAQAAAQSIAPKPKQAELSLDNPAPVATPGSTAEVIAKADEALANRKAAEQALSQSTAEWLARAETPVADETTATQDDEAFAELERQRAEEAGMGAERLAKVAASLQAKLDADAAKQAEFDELNRQQAETPNPEPSALDAVNAELAAAKEKIQKIKERARAAARKAQGSLGFFGTDPTEQAIAEARLFKAHVELGYLLLKKGYVKFKIWAREFIRESGDISSIRHLRRVYSKLRDTPDAAAELIEKPADQVQVAVSGMDADTETERTVIADTPSTQAPGYFGSIENLMDWLGNTTFFEGRSGMPGSGKSHRIYVDTVETDGLSGASYRLVYLFGKDVVPTGDVVVKTNDTEWAFNGQAVSAENADLFRMYTTTLLDGSFTELPDGSAEEKSHIVRQVRSQWNAFNQIVRLNDRGQLSFRSPGDVARWAASNRFVDGDQRYALKADMFDNEIVVFLAGTHQVVGKFHLVREKSDLFQGAADEFWVFGSEDTFSDADREHQSKFQVLGFETQDSAGRVHQADTPKRVMQAWPTQPRTQAPTQTTTTHNPMAGFGGAPMSPLGHRVSPAKTEPPFKNYAEMEAWLVAKRARQGHKLDINAVRKYIKNRGPRSLRTSVDKAIAAAEKAYSVAFPEEQTSDPIVELRDNGNLGVQYARFVRGPLGLRPLFTNNVFETAVQINMGYRPEVPAGFTGKVHPNIAFDPETRIIRSASDASGKVSAQGDHLAIRQRDARVIAKSEARMNTEDEMNEALLNDFDFVDGLPKAPDEDNILRQAQRKLSYIKPPSHGIWDRSLIELVAMGNLFRNIRLMSLQAVVDATGYSQQGRVVDATKLPLATKAVGDFITQRRAQAIENKKSLKENGESLLGLEDVSVLPNRFEALARAAATAWVARLGGEINHGAYWNRAFDRVRERYQIRVKSVFAAPAVTLQYNEEGSEQPDLNDEEQLASQAFERGMEGDSPLARSEAAENNKRELAQDRMKFDDIATEDEDSEEAFISPEGKPSGKAVQLDLFGHETKAKAKTEDEEEGSPALTEVEEPVNDLAEEKAPGISLISEASEEPEVQPDKEVFHISSAVATQRNKNQRAMMRRILRGLPIELRNAVFNSPTTDRFDRIMETYHMMRKALIRAKLLRSEERPTFREAMDAVFKHHAKVPGFEKIFPVGTMDVFNHFSRAFASAPGTPNSKAAQAAAEHLGLVSGDPQSAIDALRRIVSSDQVDPATRQLAQRMAELPAVQALQQFTMIPTGTRGLFIPGIAAINISPQGSVQELAESLLHEFGHLATEQAFIDIEGEVASPEVKEAYDTITQLREELAGQARQGAEVFNQAFENNEEFMSFLFSDPAFNSWVSSRPASWLKKLVNAIRRLLGLRIVPNPAFEKAWAATLLIANRPAMFAQTAEKVSEQTMAFLLRITDFKGARPLMAGVNAQNIPDALKASFAQAQEMSANKESIEKIRKETGWFRAPTDRQWRWEISDQGASFTLWKPTGMQDWRSNPHLIGGALGDILNHPELYAAYPEARYIKVSSSGVGGPRGSFTPSTNTITLAYDLTGEARMRTLIHEVQHWLQEKEGFLPGSSRSQIKKMIASGELTAADIEREENAVVDEEEEAYDLYRAVPGEREARLAAHRLRLTTKERAQNTLIPWYPVTKLVLKLRELAAKGGISTALDAAEDSNVEISTTRDSPAWYNGDTDTIYLNPDIIALETQNMSAADAQEYMVRLMKHENIHRADYHSSSQEEYKAYGDAMLPADFEWIAARYYVDPAEREYALGKTPGMSAAEKAQQRQGLIAEHRRAMIELAEQGETTEQFALFAASNPGLVARIAHHIANFIRKLAAQIQLRNYNGSARDLRHVMETLNNIAELEHVTADPEEASNQLFEDLAIKLAAEGGKTPTEDTVQYWSSEVSMALRAATRNKDDKLTDVGGIITSDREVLSGADSVKRHTARYTALYNKLKSRYPEELAKLSRSLAESPAFDIAEAKSVAVPIMSRRLGNYKVGGWGTTGFLNAEAAEAARVRDAKLRAMQTRVQQHRDDLSGAVKQEYASKGLAEPTDLINQALGSIENAVSPQQIAVAENLRTRSVRNAVKDFLGQMNLANSQNDAGRAAIIRENARKAYRDGLAAARKVHKAYLNRVEAAWIASTRAKQAAAFAALAPETSKAVRMIRDDLDAMQQRLLESGVLGPKTAARVTKTFGIYLTRSYQVYNETMVTATGVKRNLWTEFLRNGKDPKAQALLDAARAAIFEDAVVEKAKELRRINNRARTPMGPFANEAAQKAAIAASRKANPPLSSADALIQARAALRASGGIEVENLLEQYIEMGENIDNETDVLKRREHIHPAIQALWGVYEENEYNAYNTMMKINTLLSTQKMFNDIYEHGKANGYIFDKEGVYLNGERTVPLGGTGTQANRNRFGILAGTYGPALLKAGLEEAFGGNASSVSTLWNTLRAITGYAMATKTKYSIQGTARNFVGNIMFAAVNLNLHKLFSTKARKVVGRQLNLLSQDKTAFDNYIRRLIELRVVSESAYEFRDLTKEFSQQMVGRVGSAIRGNKKLEAGLEGIRKLDKLAGRLHQGADDYWKVLSFEGELGRVKKWEPNLTQEQAEEKAAWKIRHTMPTYTEAFYFIKRLRQQPFISPFITFTAEIYRTTFGTLKVGLNEIADGHRTGNAAQAVFGASRILLMTSALAAMPQLIAMIGKAAFGAGDDDKEEGINPQTSDNPLSRFVPEYMRGNSLMRFKGKDHNEQIYMDASYLLPQDIIGKVIRVTMDALMKPETVGPADKAVDAGMAFMKQVMEPVTKEQLFFGAVMQAKFNYNQAYDRKIYNDTDTPMEMTDAIVKHIYTSALEPGTLRTGRLIWEAADGVVRDGMKLEVANEMLGVIGIKKRTIVLDTRFTKNAEVSKLKLSEAVTRITNPMQSTSTVSDEEIVRGYNRANEVRMDTLREARRDYLAAVKLGMPQGKAVALMRDSSLSDDDVAMVVGNIYTPYQISDQVFEKALKLSKVVGQDRARIYLEAMKQYPKRQPLIPE